MPYTPRTNLAATVLSLEAMGIKDPLAFDFMDPPPIVTLNLAMEVSSMMRGTLKHQYWYEMKGLGLGSKHMLFVFRFFCCLHFININNNLFTF
jgi:hypothetical protein